MQLNVIAPARIKFKCHLNFGETLSVSYPFDTDQNFADLKCWSIFGVILPIFAPFVLKI